MPLILAKKEMAEPLKPEGKWGRPKGEFRYICREAKDDAGIYVVEAPPARRAVSYMHKRYTLWWPWTYFFVKAKHNTAISAEAPAYIMIAKERLGLDQNGLLLPYLPNTFAHCGICPDHDREIKGKTPKDAVKKFIQWFWFSNGNGTFGRVKRPRALGGGNMYSFLNRWSEASLKEVTAVDWGIPKYKSIRKAALHLRFRYWTRDSDETNDMTAAKADLGRVEIGGIE